VSLPRKPRRLPKSLTLSEINKIIKHIESDTSLVGLRDLAIIETLYCGPRNGEITRLDINNIDFENGNIRVIGKGDKEIVYALSDGAIHALKQYIEAVEAKTTIFNVTGKGLIDIVRKRAHEALGRYDITPHTFRHSFAMHALEATGDIRMVQQLLNHENISTTTIYTESDASSRRKWLKGFHSRCGQ